MDRPRLFHFSDDPAIDQFVPRPVVTASTRTAGQEWLNGPLVWAITEERQAAYLFPRDCPRVLLWLVPTTTEADRAAWWGERNCEMIAATEWAWHQRVHSERLYRYELPSDAFEPVDDRWMWVSRVAVTPTAMTEVPDLADALRRQKVELRFMDTLVPLRPAWDSTLHTSGIRLRNAAGWER